MMDMTDEQREALKTKRFLSGMRWIGLSVLIFIGLFLSLYTYDMYYELRSGSDVSSGHYELKRHEYDKAIAHFQDALRISQRNHRHDSGYLTYLYLGEAYRCQGKFDQAMKEYHLVSTLYGNPMVLKGMKRALAHDKTPLF